MGLHWGAAELRKLIGDDAWNHIQSVQVDPNKPTAPHDHLSFYNAKTGEVMIQSPIDYFYRLRRSALRAFLLPDLDVRFGKSLDQIEYSEDNKSATAKFTDGSTFTSRL